LIWWVNPLPGGTGPDQCFYTYIYHGIYQPPKSPHFHLFLHTMEHRHKQFRSPVKAHVPQKVDTRLLFTISVDLLNCNTDKPCAGPFGKRFAASMNSISFVTPPSLDILQAYYYGVVGVFERNFPHKPPNEFNYTVKNLPANLLTPSFGTEVRVLEYNASVEIILQGTNVLAADNHPIHLHG